MKFAFINVEKAHFSVSRLCRILCVSRSGYYASQGRPQSERVQKDAKIGPQIRAIHAENRRTYGSPRVHAALRSQGVRVGRKRVERLMRAEGLRPRVRRRFRKTTDSNHSYGVAPNVLDRRFDKIEPNQTWVSDITYLWTRQGWLYLAVLLNLGSRKVVGWSMRETLDTPLVSDMLTMALRGRKPAKGLLHHSDRGSQYASTLYRKTLTAHGVIASMSRKGNCWDNAVAESFFATFKTECTEHYDLASHDQARAVVFEYIETFYNRKRLHSTLGYQSPEQYERSFTKIAGPGGPSLLGTSPLDRIQLTDLKIISY